MTLSIGGLVSGIDTSTLIDQLISAASQPQVAEQNQLARLQATDTMYQAVNSFMSSIGAKAATLADPNTWKGTTVASSDPSIVATGSATAQPGAYTTFSVTQVATAQVTTMAVSGATVADPASGINVVGSDGVSHNIAIADGSPATVAQAINGAGLGVRAALISTDGGQVMQFTSTATGSAAAFSVTGLSGPTNDLVSAQNAKIQVGTASNGGYTVSSATNTFTNAIPGVTFTVSAPVSNVTLSVASDEKSISDSVQAMVNSVNSALTEITNDTAKGQFLQGDSTVLSLQQSLLSVISAGTTNGGSFGTYGISLTSTGQLTFDPSAFASAYAADPTGTQTALQGSLAPAFTKVASSATDTATGSITQLLSSDSDQEKQLTTEIADWTTKLADQKTALQQKFADMETALSKLKSEGSYLDSIFGTSSSSSSNSSSSSSTSK